MKTIAVRLQNGQDLMAEIKRIARDNEIEAGVILSGVGSLPESNIRVSVIDGKVKMIHPQDVEIVALQGTVSRNGCHIHIAVSDVGGRAWGGHVKEGCIVRMTCELVIGILNDKKFSREPDEATGFDEPVVG